MTLLIVGCLMWPARVWPLTKTTPKSFEEALAQAEVIIAGNLVTNKQFETINDTIKYSAKFGVIRVTAAWIGPFKAGGLIPYQELEMLMTVNGLATPSPLNEERIWLLNKGYGTNANAEYFATLGYPRESENYFGASYSMQHLKLIEPNLFKCKPLLLRCSSLPQTAAGPVMLKTIARNCTSATLTIPHISIENETLYKAQDLSLVIESRNNDSGTSIGMVELDEAVGDSEMRIGPGEMREFVFDLRKRAQLDANKRYKVYWKYRGEPFSNYVVIYATDEYDLSVFTY